MELNISGIYTYVPKWRGNDKLPEQDRITVEYRYMTPEEEERFTAYTPVYRGENHSEMEIKIDSKALAIWNTCVLKVDGIKDAVTKGNVNDPKKVSTIPGTYKLITEVVAVIKKGLDEEELKNSA